MAFSGKFAPSFPETIFVLETRHHPWTLMPRTK